MNYFYVDAKRFRLKSTSYAQLVKRAKIFGELLRSAEGEEYINEK